MPFERSLLGGRFPPGLPTVSRVASGRFGKLSDEVVHRIRSIAADEINLIMDEVAVQSAIEVPKDTLALLESMQFPGNDHGHRATELDMDATISYNTRYAHAQEEGFAIQDREGDLIIWVVEEYTTPGTKAHFLEDPIKAAIPTVERRVGTRVWEELGRR